MNSVTQLVSQPKDSDKIILKGNTPNDNPPQGYVYIFADKIEWGITNAKLFHSFGVAHKQDAFSGMEIGSNGSKLYTVSYNEGNIYEWDIKNPWDISTTEFKQVFNASAQDGAWLGIAFKPDGTKMFLSGNQSNNIYEYALSSSWDISTATLIQGTSVSAQDGIPQDLTFKSDGTKMYIVGAGTGNVFEYNLSTPWDISTKTLNNTLDISSQETTPHDITFKPDGLKMFIVGNTDNIFEYTLSTAWDISTASLTDTFAQTADGNPHGLLFKPDGSKLFIAGNGDNAVHELSLPTWDYISSNVKIKYPTGDIEELPKLNGNNEFTGNTDFKFMPNISGTKIVASGSNSDGEWVKYADGTMIITIEGFSLNNFAGIASGDFLWASWNFPQTFIDKNWSFSSSFRSEDSATGLDSTTTNIAGGNTSSLGSITCYRRESNVAWFTTSNSIYADGDSVLIDVQITGRWK